MGCDIHCHVEIKIDGTWHHYNMPDVDRNYRLFALMADVRNYNDDIEPISQPKGLPNDLLLITKRDAEHWGVDGHSHSWFSTEDMKMLEFRGRQLNQFDNSTKHFESIFGYLDGNGWTGFVDFPTDRRPDAQDFRLVFWFDN